MNNLLNIKLKFESEKNRGKFGPRNFTKSRKTSSQKLSIIIDELEKVKLFYKNNTLIKDMLIDVYYNDIIPKSGRIQELFKDSGVDCNNLIVGARFSDRNKQGNHIITYYVPSDIVNETINKVRCAKLFLDKELNGEANSNNFDNNIKYNYSNFNYSKSKIRDTIIDCSVIERIGIPDVSNYNCYENFIVTFYQTEKRLDDVLDEIGIDRNRYYYNFAGKNTISVNKDTLDFLVSKIPYMISMLSNDISTLEPSSFNTKSSPSIFEIPDPTNEPIIGVIDTLFEESVYFGKWVEYHCELDPYDTIHKEDYIHGTSVTSIIVDGPKLNPDLEDECGRFRVRHFGVCTHRISVTRLVNKIEKIIEKNTDIHVWNLSLGTDEETSKNFISFDAAIIDSLEEKYDVIFIIAGTNDNRNKSERKGLLRVGSPADSINSIVVNSIRRDGKPASYSREGKVLSFFNKPDVSYYGGDYDEEERINVYSSTGLDRQYGTSLAAPWIARKMSYLIDIMKINRETAKALLIDSAAGWKYKKENHKLKNIIGYGIVPKKMSSIIKCDDAEIRFIVSDTTSAYKTSNYRIPIPIDDNKYFYTARATLCYFPECNRLQGVDYTQRELSVKFGRVGDKDIIDINKNTQDEKDKYNDERKARNEFRKWENTKFISSVLTANSNGLKLYNSKLWGISLHSKERRTIAKMNPLRFGLVITLKNLKDINHLEDFKHSCLLQGYICEEIKIDNKVEIYNKAQEEVIFEQ